MRPRWLPEPSGPGGQGGDSLPELREGLAGNADPFGPRPLGEGAFRRKPGAWAFRHVTWDLSRGESGRGIYAMIHPDLAVAIRDALALAGTPEDDSVRGCLFLIIESCVSPRGPAGGNWGRFARLRACAKPHGHDGPWHRYGIVLRTWERLPSGRWADLPHAPYGVEAPDGPPGMSGERARVG